jgi:ankyrin repeat protein
VLLDTGKVDVNAKDNDGQTPLYWAVENGRKGIVKLLLDTDEADVDAKDKCGRTPLYWAAENAHEGIDKFLF